jgi:sterol desaturase/sphingolipid hydroxylase (fatty acid hydroxylase superfamily)
MIEPLVITFGLDWDRTVLIDRTISSLAKKEPMRRITKAVIVVVVIGLVGFFFFAPVIYWYSLGSPVARQTADIPLYRSLGCATMGFGDLYAPNWFGFSFGCNIPVPLPL